MAKHSGVFHSLTSVLRHPPEAWLPGRMMALRAMRPVETFIHTEAAGGITLIAAAVVAIVWAIAKTAVLTGSLVAAAVGLLLAIAFFPRKAGGR